MDNVLNNNVLSLIKGDKGLSFHFTSLTNVTDATTTIALSTIDATPIVDDTICAVCTDGYFRAYTVESLDDTNATVSFIQSVYIKGAKGDTGETGATGATGANGVSITGVTVTAV